MAVFPLFPYHLLQVCKAVAASYTVTMDALPPQSAELLALKQACSLREELPRPDESIHYQRVSTFVVDWSLCGAPCLPVSGP